MQSYSTFTLPTGPTFSGSLGSNELVADFIVDTLRTPGYSEVRFNEVEVELEDIDG